MNSIVITGGHHTSALPIIAKLREKYPDIKIYWFGHKYSMLGDKNTTLEYRDITALDIKFFDLKAGKLYKTFNPFRLIKVPFGIFQALYLLKKLKPELVFSLGGYLAAPTVLAAHLLNIKSITHEQTVVIGYANKFIIKFVDKILYTWPESAKYLPADKSVLTGLPLREDLFSVKSNEFNINNTLKTIYITAGKTGSHIINSVIKDSLSDLLSKYNLIHQCGDNSVYNDYDDLNETYSLLDKSKVIGKYNLKKFVYSDNIGEAFSKSDIVIGRSGAHTVYELISLNKPALLIPIPWVSHNEQHKNALKVKDFGLAEILEESELTKESFLEKVEYISKNINKYKLNTNKDKSLVKTNSVDLIINEIEKTYSTKA